VTAGDDVKVAVWELEVGDAMQEMTQIMKLEE